MMIKAEANRDLWIGGSSATAGLLTIRTVDFKKTQGFAP
jgi:hypothetical protein